MLLREFLVYHIPSTKQLAYIFTKHLAIQSFLGMHTKFNVIQLPLSLKGYDKVNKGVSYVVTETIDENYKLKCDVKTNANCNVIDNIPMSLEYAYEPSSKTQECE